jgi:hypothetical protein
MKTCGFEKHINAYLDGELSGAKLRSFEAHLQECPRCRGEVEQYREMLGELRAMEEREVPALLQQRLHTALSSEIAKGDGRVKRKLNPWALTAAAAALVVCLVTGTVLIGTGGLMQNQKAASPDMLSGGLADFGTASSTGSTGEGMLGAAEKPMPTAAATMAPMAPEAPRYETDAKGAGETADYRGETTGGANALAAAGDSRKIIYTANLVVETREFSKCMATVDGVLAEYGGYRESSQEYGVPDADTKASGRTAVITLRMPISKYDAAMDELQAMGNVLSKNESTEDVSRQYVDTEARNKTLKMQRDQLYDLLAKADSMENIIALQNEITRLTVEIEQMTAQLNYWDDKVSYSTITVELRELVTPKTVKPVDPDLNSRMNGALNVTLNNMKTGLEDFAVSLVGFLPWLAILLVVAVVAVAIAVPAVRRARKAAAKGAPEKKKEE